MENLQLTKFDAPGAIESVKTKVAPFAGLTISGMEDKAGYEAVRIAIGECVSTRTEFVSRCKTAREDATAYSKYVVEKEKEGVEAIRKVEDALRSEKEKIDSEKERIKAEKEQEEQKIFQGRITHLAKYGYSHYDLAELKKMSLTEYTDLLERKQKEWEDAEKVKAEKLEAERLEREEFDKKKAEQDAREKEIADREAAILAKEREAESIRLRNERAEEMERNRKEASERAIKETEERLKNEQLQKEAIEARQRELAEKQEKETQEKLERNRRYKRWLEVVGYSNGDDIRKSEDGMRYELWRKVSEFVI